MTSHLPLAGVGGAAEHLSLDVLADHTVGVLSAEEAATAESHLAGCEACRAELAQLGAEVDAVSTRLGGLASPAVPQPGAASLAGRMPVTVAARLDRVLAEEAGTRLSGQAAHPESTARASATGRGATVTSLGRSIPLMAPATATYVKQTGVLRIMLAAAVAAAVVGFGGYVISATAGLNEPSALSPTQVHPEALASQAERIARNRDLDAHVFSAAWRCARKVTSGRITGITPVYVDGDQQYLVYTRSGGITYATLIKGCDDSPSAGRPVRLTE